MPDRITDRRRYLARIARRRSIGRTLHRLRTGLGLTDETWQLAMYRAAFGEDHAEAVRYNYAYHNDHMPDFERPTWLNEKIRWQYLQEPNPLMSLCADKLAVRGYLRHKDAVLQPPEVIAHGHAPEGILTADLPERFVLKSTHGSRQILIADGSRQQKREALARLIAEWNRDDWWRRFAEMHYRPLQKGWIVEEYLPAAREQLEFKIFCYMGEPRFVTVITERAGGAFLRVTHDLDWNRVPFATQGRPFDPRPVARPDELELILSEARRLAAPFLYVRVDFLKHDGRLAFSELTFAPAAAVMPYSPPEANEMLGAMIDLEAWPALLAEGRGIAAQLGWPAEAGPSVEPWSAPAPAKGVDGSPVPAE